MSVLFGVELADMLYSSAEARRASVCVLSGGRCVSCAGVYPSLYSATPFAIPAASLAGSAASVLLIAADRCVAALGRLLL